ncbi:probable RNA-dependent RNA polymerase 1 [Papaver somniferum]|uniref:probable RNA-dependent RNA polymerase 1 n=1 Tax=Papaver somniferum TaxID=3469 RepID=UPI000E6F85AF|nr:probable RNA-dependent RNA polymerase 1 [Papaver somniferum]
MGRTVEVDEFPSYVNAEMAKEFLEKYTGKGTVYALLIKKKKAYAPLKMLKFKRKGTNPRVFAKVQFISKEDASSLINKQLNYDGKSYLKVTDLALDIVPNSRLPLRVSVFRSQATALYFGDQVSDNCFLSNWKGHNVIVDFEFGFRRLSFLLSYLHVDYKLELTYESIWRIHLHRSENRSPQMLLIQMFAAPKVYKKFLSSSEDSALQYYKDTFDDKWVRTTDFTQSCCIGRSSAICLKLPDDCHLPDFRVNFPHFKEDKYYFALQEQQGGSIFCQSSDLVPIVASPQGLENELPYEILFRVSSLVQRGCLPGPTLDAAFFEMVDPRYIPAGHIERALEKLYHLRECCYEPAKWLDEQYLSYSLWPRYPGSPAISLDKGLVSVRKVQVTPSKVYFCGPEVIISNRVLRHFHRHIDNFIRISFVDEDWEKLRPADLSSRSDETEIRTALYTRVLSTLRNGIVIGDKKFDFLAFSSSQLRNNSAWMFASVGNLTAAGIRDWMGDFREIRNVAKYAARLGQSFGSSTETLNVYSHEVEIIPDIEIESNETKYTFSDGIGKISYAFAREVANKCGLEGFSTPTAFQVRYGGYKGVVAVDPMSRKKLSLRKSMHKFKSKNTTLDVLAWSKYQPCFLNRQVITLLSTLGVSDSVFEKKQKEVTEQLDLSLTDPLRAYETLAIMSPGESTNIIKEMLLCGYMPNQEPFLSMMLQTFRASKLHELSTKTRIFIPKGRSMIGCLDERGILDYGQVFIQVSAVGSKQFHEDSFSNNSLKGSEENNFVVVGKVVVAKKPCLHPCDIRVLCAVDVPALHHTVDCVVFPQKGKRPHPNECSGSDLDGDVYFVSWDPELIPPRQVEAMNYAAAPTVLLDHDVRTEEVEQFFTDYMINDNLGLIGNTHFAFADFMAESSQCKELAKLFSIAVDFPKTGVPAVIPPHLRVDTYPDFMEKFDKPSYISDRVIGRLFRQVKGTAPNMSCVKSFTREVAEKSYDHDMEFHGFEKHLVDAKFYKGEYDFKLGNLLAYYGIQSEAEIFGGGILKMSKSFNMRKDAEAISLEFRSLRNEARTWFDENSGTISVNEAVDDIYAKASAWYYVTYHPSYWGCYNDGMKRAYYLSFPWCVYDKLIHIKRKNTVRNQVFQLISS